ncbi:MAG: septum site-determining protein MinC [Anaerolineae bacterium]|nr:septum site-determining protein MinC [Anaerolineae bacterium]MDW8171223.1 septum site-determining protein MinC [Anaerolineae bacterium]
MNKDIVSIKGINDGLLITLSTTEEWQVITTELAARLDEQSGFFAGAKITVDLGERPVPKYELSSLRALLERRGLALLVVQSGSATTLESANALDLRAVALNQPLRNAEGEPSFDPDEDGTLGLMIRRTLRSGRRVHSRGHVVIVGDVNPGAEVVASGDIVVWGKLRGTVHAGAEGDESAVVCALDMSPSQLRIAAHIVTSPKDKRRQVRPEMACVRHNQIVVEAWEA